MSKPSALSQRIRQAGFTLIELMVVLVVMLIVLAVLMPIIQLNQLVR